MPARWQSSQRPLFVRTIWVNGLRHAVLSADDPLLLQYRKLQKRKSRPGSCSSVETYTSSCSSASVSSRRHKCANDIPNSSCCCDLQPCLIKLQLVLNDSATSSSSSAGHERSARRHRTSSSRPSARFRAEVEDDDSSPIIQCERVDRRKESTPRASISMVGQYNRPYLPHMFPSSSDDEEPELSREHDLQNSWLFSEVQSLLPDIQLNPLSERVLQWLDLAGRTTEKEDAHLEKRFRPTPPPSPPDPPPVVLERKTSSQPRRSMLRQRGVALSTIMSHTPTEVDSPEVHKVEETALSVTAHSISATRTGRRCGYEEARAVIDITEPHPLPPVRVQSPPSTPPPVQPVFQKQHLPSPAPTSLPPPPPLSVPCNRPQLHIFMPVLPRETPKRYLPDDVSECDSYWSEA